MIRHRFVAAAFGVLICTGAAPAEYNFEHMSYDQAVAALQELVNGSSLQTDSHTPGLARVSVTADEKGILLIRQEVERDHTDLRFTSQTEQTWRVNAADLDAKRVTARNEPISVYAPVKKDARRVRVERTETKHRLEGNDEPADDWQEHDAFSTSFVTIPVATFEAADEAAALVRQIAKAASKQH